MAAKKTTKKAAKRAATKAAKKAANRVAKKAAAKKGRKPKKPEDYITNRSGTVFSLSDYTKKPAVCFLTQVVEAKNSFDYCKSKFPTGGGTRKLTKEAKDNLQQVTGPLFAATMGHFETFQKCFFAGLFDASRLLANWDSKSSLKVLGNEIELSPVRLSGYRGQGAQVGLLVADSLTGWHSPWTVTENFKCFESELNFFSKKESEDLEVLWQARHTLVHTSGWLTLPDAQKVKRLSSRGDSALAFDETFMLAFTKLMHRVVKSAVERLEKKLRPRLRSDLDASEKQEFDDLMKVDSPSASFFPK